MIVTFLQGAAASLLLPPLGLVIAIVVLALLAWRGWRRAALASAAGGVVLLLLSTPVVAGLLAASLDRSTLAAPGGAPAPGAIIILGAEMASGAADADIGPLTLERLRTGAALHRRLGLPILVTGGPLRPREPPIAELMARSLSEDFGTPARWTEDAARDTRDNAALATAKLRGEGVRAAYLVTHAWHMPRAMEAFRRDGFAVIPAPVHRLRTPEGSARDWVPRPDHLALTWYALREWLGRAVYAVRDGG